MCIIFHKWGKWGRPLDIGIKFSQFRECSKCGILSSRATQVKGNIGFSEIINSLDKLKLEQEEEIK